MHILDKFFSLFCSKNKVVQSNKQLHSVNEVTDIDDEYIYLFSKIDMYITISECEYAYNWNYINLYKKITDEDICNKEYVGRTVISIANEISMWWHYEYPRKLEQLDYLLSTSEFLISNKKTENDIDWNRINDLIDYNRTLLYDNSYIISLYNEQLKNEKDKLLSMINIAKDILVFLN